MKRLLIFLLFLIAGLALVSCFKEDERVMPHPPGNTQIDTVCLANNYKYQVYFDLQSGSAVQSRLRKDWDLSFEVLPGGWHVRLNTSCFMYAAVFDAQEFGIMADTSGSVWKFDNSNGDNDSTALDKWFTISGEDTVSNGKLILINRGIDENGNDRGFRQLVIDSLVNGTYYIRTADVKGANQQTFAINPEAGYTNKLFSFDKGLLGENEPPKQSWDLLFSQYTTMLYTDIGEPYPYLVTGVLLNPNLVEVAIDTGLVFGDITFEDVSGLDFTSRQDVIGYDWKYYDFDSGSYTVDIDKIYIIRDVEGYHYKFRFLGFYNEKGEKGFPSFEYQQL